MSTGPVRRQNLYGFPNVNSTLQQEPIIANRAPTTADSAEIGTIWADQNANTFYVLVNNAANVNTWRAQATGGATTLASLLVTPGNLSVDTGNAAIAGTLTAGAATLTSVLTGNIVATGTLQVANDTTVQNLTVGGDFTATGDFDITDTASIGLTSTNNAVGAITLLANGGALETILVQSAQGTSDTSINVNSVAGGITLDGGKAAATAVNITASDVAGGITATAGTGGILADATGTISLDSLVASNFVVTGAGQDLTLGSVGGSVVVEASEASAAAVSLIASDLAGGLFFTSGTGGVTLLTTGDLGLDSALTSHVTVTGAAQDLLLSSVGGSVQIDGSQAAADAVTITASDAAGGVIVTSGTGATVLTSTGATTIDAAGVLELNSSAAAISIGNDAVAQNINVGTGAAARVITIGNITGATAVNINTGSAGSTVTTTNAAFGLVTGTGAINLGTDAAAKTVTIGNITGATAVNVNTGTGGSTWTTTNGAFGLVTGTGAINLGADAAAKTITIGNATGATSVVVNCGTGACNLGTTATAHATTVGSTTAGSTLALQTPAATYVVAAEGISVTAAGAGLSLPGGILVLAGAGDPNGAVTAPIGSLWIRSNPAGAASRLYINTDAGTTWTNFTAAA